MGSYYVRKSGKSGWIVAEQVYKDGKPKQTTVPTNAYSALGIREGMSLEEAKARIHQINKANKIEKHKIAGAARNVAVLKIIDGSIPEAWVTVYSGDIGNTFILNGSSTGSTRCPVSSSDRRT